MLLFICSHQCDYIHGTPPHIFLSIYCKFHFIASKLAIWAVRAMKPQTEIVKMKFSLENDCL